MKNLFRIEISSSRIYGLDILRAFAILFVVVGHGQYLLPDRLKVFHRFIVFDGVSIFFVLSGFLIGGILIKLLDKNEPTKELLVDFWIRRWFRTLPNYFLILFLLIGLSQIFNENITFWEVKEYFVFAQNLFYNHPGFFPEAWSLSIEEWFYLITPICIFSIMYFLKIESKRAIILVALLVIFLTLTFRYYRYLSIGIDSWKEWDKILRKQVFTRLDSLMFGVICAYIQYYYKSSWLKYKYTLLLIGLAIFIATKALSLLNYVSSGGFYHCVLSFVIISLATSLLLPYLSDLKSGKGIIYKGLTIISLISYSMYLLNLSVVQKFIINKIHWDNFIDSIYIIVILRYGLYWIFTVLGSIIIYKFYELPTMKLRDNEKIKKTVAILCK